MRKPGSPFEEHFGQQAPAAQLTGAQAPAGELIGHRSPARSRAAFAPRPSGRSCWPLTASAPARQISSVKRTQSTRRDKDGTLFLSACRISNCARTKCTGGNRRAGEQAELGPTARGTGAAPLTYGQARHACCSRCAHPSPVLQLEANVIPRCARARARGVGRPEVRDTQSGRSFACLRA